MNVVVYTIQLNPIVHFHVLHMLLYMLHSRFMHRTKTNRANQLQFFATSVKKPASNYKNFKLEETNEIHIKSYLLDLHLIREYYRFIYE